MAQADFISIHAPPRGATNTISRLSRHRHFNSRPSARGDTDSARVTGKALVFQFTPLREGRPQNEICLRPVTGFQFTPLREGRLTWSKRANTPRYFNSRPSARGDMLPLVCGSNANYFNSRPSARGDDQHHQLISIISHFNSRPSARGDVQNRVLYTLACISIHAPPRGATCVGTSMTNCFTIFQFTPLREGRHTSNCISCFVDKFQFTPLREGRLGSQNVTRQRVQISIHAPPRGATLIRFFNRFPLYFNSRPSARGDGYCRARYEATFISIHAPPRGATQVRGLPPTDSRISIHAPPRGATATRYPHWYKPFHFNSRPSARGDERHYWDKPSTVRFQFTPLREGRRHEDTGLLQNGNHFNSRPSARGDGAVSKTYVDEQISIHAPPRGATVSSGVTVILVTLFQFTPLREGRHGRTWDEWTQLQISIHAPPRGATKQL